MWELVKRSLQRERTMTAAQLGRPRRVSVQRMHNEIVEAFLKAGRQRVRRSATGRLGSMDSVSGEDSRGVRGGIWRAVSSLGFAIKMAIRLLNPYVLISVALGQRQGLLAQLTARVDSMRAVLSPRIGRRRRLTAWVRDLLPQRHVPEAASAVWQDGSLLCGIVEAAVPGSCPGYDSLSPPNADRGATLWLGQKLAARYLGVPPAFTDDEFSLPHLTVHMERRMLRYLSALKSASARVEVERQRRQDALENSSAGPVAEEDAFSLDTVANSSLPPGESLLECVARGMGLVLGVQGRKSTFYIYLNPNHPHRHVHRLMRSSSRSSLERQSSFEDEAGAILMQIRGPEGDFGATLLSTSPGSSSYTTGLSLDILNENWYGRIPITYETTEASVTVSYVPQSPGRHELILLLRGGSHVPGSPFSITVEEASEVPDDNGTRRRFGSEPVEGLLPPPKAITKATSYESGLDMGHRRIDSGGSDPGTRSEGDNPAGASGAGRKRRVVSRVVDFVTEKMLLTEDGKLERLPKRRKMRRELRSDKYRGLLGADDEVGEITHSRRYSTMYTSWGRMKHLEVDEPIHGTYPGRRSQVENGESETTYGVSKSGLEMDAVSGDHSWKGRKKKGKGRESDKVLMVSDAASYNGKESIDSINFREHCRRILWLCDILLKHSPRQESLEILNTAGDILEGKRVHPTIMEESEPEDATNVAPSQVSKQPPAAQQCLLQARETTPPPSTKSLAQRLQREPSDTGGLNEVSAWKDSRRQFHSWARKEREGGGTTVGGRLIHKGGSYRGVVVRDMTPEALTGAYAGDDLVEDEGSARRKSEDGGEAEEEFQEEGGPASGTARHSLPKIRPPSLGNRRKNREDSEGTLERRTSARETDGGPTTVSGKELNKSIASNDKEQINYSDRGSKWTGEGGEKNDPAKEINTASAARGEEGFKDHHRCHAGKEDGKGRGVGGKNIILAMAVALAEEGREPEREEESWEEPLSDIGTRETQGKEKGVGEDDKELRDASSKGEPPPDQEPEGEEGEGSEGGEGGRGVVACGGEATGEEDAEESEQGKGAESVAPDSAEASGAVEINERPPSPPQHQPSPPPSPPTHDPRSEQSPGYPEGIASKRSDVEGSGASLGSGCPRTITENGPEGEETEVIKEGEEEEKGEDENDDEDIDEEVEMKEALEGEVLGPRIQKKKRRVRKKNALEETANKEQKGGANENEVVDEIAGEKDDVKKEGENEKRQMENQEPPEIRSVDEKKETEYNEGECDKTESAISDGISENSKNDGELERIGENMSALEGERIEDQDTTERADSSQGNRENASVPENPREELLKESKEKETVILREQDKAKVSEEVKEEIGEQTGQEHAEIDNRVKILSGKEEAANKLESTIVEGDGYVNEGNVIGMPGNEEDKLRDEELERDSKEIETMCESVEESKLVDFTEDNILAESESIEKGVSVSNNYQVAEIMEDAYSVEETVVGNEDEDLESNEVKFNLQLDCQDDIPESEKSPIKEELGSDFSNVYVVGESKDKNEEQFHRIAKEEGIVGGDERSEISEREKRNGVKEREVLIANDVKGEGEGDEEEDIVEMDSKKYIEKDDNNGKLLLRNDVEAKKESSCKVDEIIVAKIVSDEVGKSPKILSVEDEGMKIEQETLSACEQHCQEKNEVEAKVGQYTTDEFFKEDQGKMLETDKVHRELEFENTTYSSDVRDSMHCEKEAGNEFVLMKEEHENSSEEALAEPILKGEIKSGENMENSQTVSTSEPKDIKGKNMLVDTELFEEKSTEVKERKERIGPIDINKETESNLETEKDNGSEFDQVKPNEFTMISVTLHGKDEELSIQCLAEGNQRILKEDQTLDVLGKCSEVNEENEVVDIFMEEARRIKSDLIDSEKTNPGDDTIDSKENTEGKEMGDEFLDEKAPATSVSVEDMEVTEIANAATIFPPMEKKDRKSDQNDIKEDNLLKENAVSEREGESLAPEDRIEKCIDGSVNGEKVIQKKEAREIDELTINAEENKIEEGSDIKDIGITKLENAYAKEEIKAKEKKENETEESIFKEETKNEIGNTPIRYIEEGDHTAKESSKEYPVLNEEEVNVKEDDDDGIIFKREEQIPEVIEKTKENRREEIIAEEELNNKRTESIVPEENSNLEDIKMKGIQIKDSSYEEKVYSEKSVRFDREDVIGGTECIPSKEGEQIPHFIEDNHGEKKSTEKMKQIVTEEVLKIECRLSKEQEQMHHVIEDSHGEEEPNEKMGQVMTEEILKNHVIEDKHAKKELNEIPTEIIEQLVTEEVLENEIEDNVLQEEKCYAENNEVMRTQNEASSFGEKVHLEQPVRSDTEDTRTRMECTSPRKEKQTQNCIEDNSGNIELNEVFMEVEEVLFERCPQNKKENGMPWEMLINEEKRDEATIVQEINENVLAETAKNISGIECEGLENETFKIGKELHQGLIDNERHNSTIIEEENKAMMETNESCKEKCDDNVSTEEPESQVRKSCQTTLEENKNVEIREETLNESPLKEDMKGDPTIINFETPMRDTFVVNDADNISKGKQFENKEALYLSKGDKSEKSEYYQGTPSIKEGNERSETEVGLRTKESFKEILEVKEEEKDVKTFSSGGEVQVDALVGAEDGEKKKMAEGEGRVVKLERTKEKTELERGEPESARPEEEKCSKEEGEETKRRHEGKEGTTPSVTEAKSPTYGEIIGRLLCTDSFPSGSLEWFEEEERRGGGEAVEGTMKSTGEDAGVPVGTAVGDEVWEAPVALGEEPLQEAGDAGVPEASGKEGALIGGEEEEEEMEGAGEEEAVEEEGRDPWSNFDEGDEEEGSRAEVGPLRVGVGVVVAGGIVSRDRRDSGEGRDASWRRSQWRASRSKSIEEGLPLPKEDPVERQWEEICMGIDAMEDGSISQVIAEVSGKRRRRKTRKERGDRSGKAMRTREGRWGRDGTDRTLAEVVGADAPIPESPMEAAAEGAGEEAARLPSRASGGPHPKEGDRWEGGGTSTGAGGEGNKVEGEGEAMEMTGIPRERIPRVGMLDEPWWYGSSVSSSGSLGGVRIEELRVDWVGMMEEGKRGRGLAEEEGVEATEDAQVEGKAKERVGDGSKIFCGDEGGPLTETKLQHESGMKGAGAKDLKCPPLTPSGEAHLEPGRGTKERDKSEEAESVAVERRKGEDAFETCQGKGLKETNGVREPEGKEEMVGAGKHERDAETEKEGEETIEGEEQEEEDEGDEEEENKKAPKDKIPPKADVKGAKETVLVDLDETKIEDVLTRGEAENRNDDGESKGAESMQSPEGDIFAELENQRLSQEGESTFGRRVARRDYLTEGQSSGEWEFIDTGGDITSKDNMENETLNEWEGQYPYDNYAGGAKGLLLHPFIGNRDNTKSPGSVETGMEKVNNLLQSFVDIPKGEDKASIEGMIPKRESEELFGMRMAFGDWEEKKSPDCMGPETEVVVGEFDLLGDWEEGECKIGIIEVATKEHGEENREDKDRVADERIRTHEEPGKYSGICEDKDGIRLQDSHKEHRRESSSIPTDGEISSDYSESHEKNREEGIENSDTNDDEDIEEFIRTDPDEWGSGSFTFMDSNHRTVFRNMEDMFGGDFTFRMSSGSTHFNLWPSQEAFEGKGSWTEHIDMDAYRSTAQSRQKTCTGKSLLEDATTFAKTYLVGDHKRSTTSSGRHYFSGDEEGRGGRTIEDEAGEEEEIVLVEQDFDDRSDEMEERMGLGAHWGSTYHSFDINSLPNSMKGNAYAIFESPGVTTYATPEDERRAREYVEMSSDEEENDQESSMEDKMFTTNDNDGMEMLELDGGWEEDVIFLDDDEDDDSNVLEEGRRGSGEYRKFSPEVEGKADTDLWGPMTQGNENLAAEDLAYAVVMDTEDMKEKTPVLPTGRWCPRLPLLSPAMSAISEEESEEMFPEKDEKQEESTSVKDETDSEPNQKIPTEKEAADGNLREDSGLKEGPGRDETSTEYWENLCGDGEDRPLTVTLFPDNDEMIETSGENSEENESKHTIPKLDVEVEDGFGELFTRRRSSTSSVVSESGAAEPVADCGAAFVVSSELAVTLALGVSITQILPPVIDLPEIPPLPQVEEATDALRMKNCNPEERGDDCKRGDLRLKTEEYSEERVGNGEHQRNENSETAENVFLAETSAIDGITNFQVPEKSIEDMHAKKKEEKLFTPEEIINVASFAPLLLLDEFYRGEGRHEGRGLHLGGRTINEVRSSETSDESYNCEKYRTEMDVNNKTGARKKRPEATAGGNGESEVLKIADHRAFNVFEQKNEPSSREGTSESEKENEEGRNEGKRIMFPEPECDWYSEEGEGIECWSNGRLITKAITEGEDVKHKEFTEGKTLVCEEKQRAPETERSVLPAGETGKENKQRAEDKTKSSPPGGARKKESPDKKTRDSPPRAIPLEKLLGWPSENGNGNGLGYPGVASRRESVFDDYNFSLWENGFKLNRQSGNEGSKRQDSTGLEYYLDVDQLLNVPLAATEPEVKYVSAKEIMDTFTRGLGIDSPEKSAGKDSDSNGGKAFKSDSLDELEGAIGGTSSGFLDGGLMKEVAGCSNSSGNVRETKGQAVDLWEDDLFAEFSMDSNKNRPKAAFIPLPQIFTSEMDDNTYDFLGEDRKDSTKRSISKEEAVVKEKITDMEITKEVAPGSENEGEKKELLLDLEAEKEKNTKTSVNGNLIDQRQHEMPDLSSKENLSNKSTQKEIQPSGRNVRSMIDMFERPASTKTTKESTPGKADKAEKSPIAVHEVKNSTGALTKPPGEAVVLVTTENQVNFEGKVIEEKTEANESMNIKDIPVAPCSPVTESADQREGEAVGITEALDIGRSKALAGSTTESESPEILSFGDEEPTGVKDSQFTDLKPPTLEEKREVILSLTKEPVVGWEAINVATEVEKIILSTGNGVEQKKTIMGEVVIGAELDKRESAEDREVEKPLESKGRTDVRDLFDTRDRIISLETKPEDTKLEEAGERSRGEDKTMKSSRRRISTSSSFEEYKTVVSEAYQFLEALGDTVDEDEEIVSGGEVKEAGGKAEDSVGDLGSESEVFHPCEELPSGEGETIPGGVEGAPTKGMVEAQSPASSPERSKTTESSSSSSPYSSLPTFADISSGILSSNSSKDENSPKTEEGSSRKERSRKFESRGGHRTKVTGDGSVVPEDSLEEEIDSSTLAKMNVASRKEYWDRRLQRAQEKSKEAATAGPKKPLPLKFTGIVARGRMSFEQSKSPDDSSTSDSGGDGGKSSSESSPSSRGRLFSHRPKVVHSRVAKSALPSKTEVKEREADKNVFKEEKQMVKPAEEQTIEKSGKESDDKFDQEIPAATEGEKKQETKTEDDEEDLSQIPVSKRKEIWDQKLQKMSEDESPPSSLEYRRSTRKKAYRGESTEKLQRESSTDDKIEKRAPLIGAKGVVQKYKQGLEEQSVSIDSSSLEDKPMQEEVSKKIPPRRTTGSVSQLAKLFSSPPPEPPPTKLRGRPIPKGKYSKGLEKESVILKSEAAKESTAQLDDTTPEASRVNTETSNTSSANQETGSGVLRQDETLSEKVPSGEKDENNTQPISRNSSISSVNRSYQEPAKSSISMSDSVTSDIDNLASRRKKYLESVQQSLEGEEGRNGTVLKKSESEDSIKARVGRNGVSDVRNIWEKRSSLDGSSSSDSMKKSGRAVGASASTYHEKKKTAQDKRPASEGKSGRIEKGSEGNLHEEASLPRPESKKPEEPSHKKPIPPEEKASRSAASLARKESGEGDLFPSRVASEQGMHQKKGQSNDIPSENTSAGRVAGSPSVSSMPREAKASSEGEYTREVTQTLSKSAQDTEPPFRRPEEKIETYKSSDKMKMPNQREEKARSAQVGIKVSQESRKVDETIEARGRVEDVDQMKSTSWRGVPTKMEDPIPVNGRRVPSEQTAPSPFKGRRHSSASVNPPRKVDICKMKKKCGSMEEKMIESSGHRFKRDSLEIRVTDDDDICVMREVTSVPRFSLKEKKMETHEEEDWGQAEGQVFTADDKLKAMPPQSSAGAKRKSLPQRTLSIQMTGIVASGRRRFEGGKAAAEDMPTLSEEIGEVKAQAPPQMRNPPKKGLEERGRASAHQGIEEEQEGRIREEEEAEGHSKRLLGAEREAQREEEGQRPRATESGGREIYRAVPVNVTMEGEPRGAGIRVEVSASEETTPASKGEEGGDDGRSATSRRASKGKAPAKQKQPPPSAASSPDSESEGAAERKLLGFLSTPAAQARRHSAVDVASLRAFSAAPAGPRLRRRGSGDLGSPSRLREDESKKRFTRARQFFETLEKGKESPPSPPQSGADEDSALARASSAGRQKKRAKSKDEQKEGRSSVGKKAGATKYRPPAPKGAKDGSGSGSTTDSDKERQHRRKSRKSVPTSEKTHSAPGSDVDSSGSAPLSHPSLHRRKRDRELVLRSQRFGGSEREVRVSERFNVMDLFRDVAGPGTGVTSGRATPLGIPHQAAVLAALRSVEDVRSSETTSPYDMYRPVEADDDCQPTSAAGAGEGDGEASAADANNEENANEEEEGNVTFSSPMTLCAKREYQAEYPHLPMTSPWHSRHRSSNADLIPRNVLLQLDASQNTPKKSSSSRRSIAELF